MFIRITLIALTLLVGATGCGSCQPRPPNPRDFIFARTGSSEMAIAVTCIPGDTSCSTAADTAACTVTNGCGDDGQCIFARSPATDCPCYEGEIRWCGSNSGQVQFCAETPPGSGKTAWQKECGPGSAKCDTENPDCAAGTRRTRFNTEGGHWEPDTDAPCVPTQRCPSEGETRWCSTGDPECAGQQTYHVATRWSECVRQCPVGECRPGESRACNTNEGCGGRQFCNSSRMWDGCSGHARCPPTYPWEGDQCMWHSPSEGGTVRYYPHRAGNNAIAATGYIGYPAPGGQPGPVYVEVTLSQWSTPPKNTSENFCGKGTHVSAWVGCIHADGGLGWGRDVADHEWEEQVMIPLRCEAHDSVGVYKYTWGHDLSWHCSRQLALRVARNHDGIPTCVW
ncbi:MAG TPA: hypothetical protein VM261_08605 [Kofleriaceae bacterium]|nr:hypothetical protein [Kofleriaceae bacterium]